MIRIVFGSALTLLGFGAAAALLGPDIVAGPRGEPLIVAGPDGAAFQQASFDGTACASSLILDEEDLLRSAPAPLPEGGTHVVTLAFRTGEDGTTMVIERGEADPGGGAAFVLVFDNEGRLLSATPTRTERERMLSDAYAADCLTAENAPSGV
jgi:hypothetical protein